MNATMTSTDPFGDRDCSPRIDERGNPFVSFSQFVDRQISSFFHNFPGFSAPPRASHEQAERDRAYEEWKAWRENFEARERLAEETTGASRDQRNSKTVEWLDSTGQKRVLADRSREQSRRLEEEDAELLKRVFVCVRDPAPSGSADDLDDQDNDDNDDDDDDEEKLPLRCPYRPSREDSHGQDDSDDPRTKDMSVIFPALLRAFRLATEAISDDPRAPVLGSKANPIPYDDEMPGTEAHWDLLKKQCEAQFSPRENPLRALASATEEPNATRQPENDAQEDAPHELAYYQRMMECESSMGNAASQPPPSGPPSIISTMTTTQRHTLPDGSVYTKIVLKKGFSDGREECTETEETTHGAPRRQMQQPAETNVKKSTPALGYDGKVKQAIEERMREQKKKGWFWS